MSRSAFIIIIAFLIIFVPLLGFPGSWYPKIFLVLGGLIMIVELYAVFNRAQDAFFREHEIETEVYVEKRGGSITKRENESNPSSDIEENSNEETVKREER